MERTFRLTLSFLLLWTASSGTGSSPCSQENRNSDPAPCLSAINSDARNNTLFWYGTSYGARCPNPYASMDCFNSAPFRADSILSRVFGDNFPQNNLVTKFVNVTFNTGTGSYTGCGNTWTVSESRTIDLDPTQSNFYKPWSVRNRPAMTWSASQSELYSIFVIDTGNAINHGIFLNIPGNNINQSEIFKDYHGPLRTSPIPNVYAFFLFKQSERIQLSEEWRQKLGNSMFSTVYNMSTAMKYLNLTGPVGLNWMSVTMDAYAMQQMITRRVLYACPNLISEAVTNHNRPFIPNNTAMTVNVDVTFSPASLTFTSCCTQYTKQGRSFKLNPLGDATVDSWDVRSEANPILDLSAYGFYTQIKNFTGKTFTVLCVDPDVPSTRAGTRERPLLHWMVVNIPEGRMGEGDTVMSYRGPRPPDRAHYYYFLLYEQRHVINANQTANYTNPPGSRFLFDISDFVSDQALSLVGVSWFIAKPDEFTRYQSVTSGGNVTSLCAGQPGFATPCPVSPHGTGSSPCSQENRNSDPAPCLSAINSDARNNTLFWYGTSYGARCPNPYASMDCFNSAPFRADSILSRVFGDNFPQNNLVTKFVNVSFNTGTGSYTGCGNTWTVSESRTIDLDPTQSDFYKPWSVRNRPAMTWSASQSELYSIFVIDTGNAINHGIFLNIPGNDINQSEIFKDYHGPLRTSPIPNVYAFFLFKQSGRIQLSEEWRQKLGNSMFSTVYNMSTAMEYLTLTGPVGLNWMSVTMDAYAMQQMITRRVLYACPNLISEAVTNHNRPFIPNNTAMTVNVDVTFSPASLTFTSCCTQYTKQGRSFNLNPLGDATVDSWDVRSEANPILDLSAYGFYTQIKNFTGKTFTVLCVDPDVPSPAAGTRERPLLHWMVVNIPEGRMGEGDTVMSYRGPRPPDAAHYYYFLLYEQSHLINTNQTANYTNPPASRFLFDISDFVSDQALSLVGVSWFIAKPDEFTRYQSVTSGGDVTSLCAGQPDFVTPCPVSGATQRGQTTYQMALAVCSILVLKTILSPL